MNDVKDFLVFAQPFINALKQTFKVMMNSDIKMHSPQIKKDRKANGDITATIGMNGLFEKGDQKTKFRGMVALSWKEDVYLKMASAMLLTEYKVYCEDVADAGAEIINIVMGNAKKDLNPMGYKIEMASPSTIRGISHELRYPTTTHVIESVVNSNFGDFTFEICFQESSI